MLVSPRSRLWPNEAQREKETGSTRDNIVEPKDEGLRATADRIRQNGEAGVGTQVNVNSQEEGRALGSIPWWRETL